MKSPVLVHADLVLTGEAREIADGAVVAEGDEIVDVGPASELRPRHAGAEIVRVHGAVMPGLVNAHTHLELSGLGGKIRGGRGFVAWVDALVGTRSEMPPEEDEAAIASAVDDLVRFGTVAVGDVTNSLAAVRPLAARGVAGSIFHEVFGIVREAVLRRVEGLRTELEERFPSWPSDLAYAPAPHTLYTTHPDAVRALAEAARRTGKPTSVHLAEHAGERRAMEEGDGPVVEWLFARTRQKREWPKQPLFDVAAELGVLAPSTLLVHVTDAREGEIARAAEAGASVVLCPRSNAHIEGRCPPLEAMLRAGLAPALGTDSLASCPSLDVLAEAELLAQSFPDVPPWQLVAMATANGARALARPDLGRFVKGARPGVLAIEGARDARAVLSSQVSSRRFVVPRKVMESRS